MGLDVEDPQKLGDGGRTQRRRAWGAIAIL